MSNEKSSSSPCSETQSDLPDVTLKARAWEWVDKRTGAAHILHKVLDEPVPGGSRFAYVFGSALMFIFALQFITGLCLAIYYVPSPVTAHVSVSYIVKEVAAGSFIRSLHSYGSSAMVVVLLLHFVQTLLYGSYKGRRELLWIAGCVLSLLVLGMAFTGYLLPWDQKAYFASSVGTNVAGQTPLVGEWIRRLLRGGASMGTLTVSRFYVLHVFVIPTLIVGFIGVHIFMFRKAGAAGPIREHPVVPRLKAEPFYPHQVLKDMAFALLVMGVLGMLAHFIPVTLGPIANPTDSHYLPRPEWYYLPLFQWLKYWEGPRAVVGMVIIPTVLVALLFLLPFLDRGIERRPWRRPIPVGAVAIVLFGLLWLGIKSHLDDAHNPAVAAQLAQQDKEESQFSSAPFEPYRYAALSDGTSATPLSQNAALGRELFDSHSCSTCHGQGGVGGPIGPPLTHVAEELGQDRLTALLQDPTAKMRSGGMVPQTNPAEREALVAYLGAIGKSTLSLAADTPAARQPPSEPNAIATAAAISPGHLKLAVFNAADESIVGPPQGEAIFQSHACVMCHGPGGAGTQLAPALVDIGEKLSDAELTRLLRNPTSKMNARGMPPVQVNDAELTSLVRYLRSLKSNAKSPAPSTITRIAVITNREASSTPSSEMPAVAAVDPPLPTPTPVSARVPEPVLVQTSLSSSPAQRPGEDLFKNRGCSVCHGVGGVGTQLAPALIGRASSMEPGALSDLLEHPTAKMRAGGMPPILETDRPFLVEYIQSLGTPSRISIATRAPMEISPTHSPSTSRDRVERFRPKPEMSEFASRGKGVFTSHECSKCHGTQGAGGTTAAPALAGQNLPHDLIASMLKHPTDRMRKGGMPIFSLSDRDLNALAAYVSYISEPPGLVAPPSLSTEEVSKATKPAKQGLIH